MPPKLRCLPAVLALLLIGSYPLHASSLSLSRADFSTEAIVSIEDDVFDLALGAASCAVQRGDVGRLTTLTVIDYSKPSTERRLWVFDLTTRALIYQELVAHGQGSGTTLATAFLNEAETSARSGYCGSRPFIFRHHRRTGESSSAVVTAAGTALGSPMWPVFSSDTASSRPRTVNGLSRNASPSISSGRSVNNCSLCAVT